MAAARLRVCSHPARPPPSPLSGQLPTASLTHFLVKLTFAAPASLRSPAALSQAVAASVSHFFMKLVSAAPASFLSVACALQLGLASGVVVWARVLPAKKQMTRTTAVMVAVAFIGHSSVAG